MEQTVGVMVAVTAGMAMFAWWLLRWWNHVRYAVQVKRRFSSTSATKLPPGDMGFPFLGEMPTFLWYFKVLCKPDHYIHSKRRKFGDGAGLFRTHLFGRPSVVAWSPEAIKFVLQTDEIFIQEWPSVELMGKTSLISVHGEPHDRVRKFLLRGINQPTSLHQIALIIQPRIIASLHAWAQRGRVTVYDEVKKVTMENIGQYFAGLEPGPVLDTLAELFKGLMDGFRAYPINLPGTAHYHATMCRKKITKIFAQEMERRKNSETRTVKNDLMAGLMQMKDQSGNQLSDVEVLDNIVSLVVGGYEPSTIAMMWAFYYLAKYPNVLKKLQEEHISLASQKQNGDFITHDDTLTCKYTSNVIEEIIRLANISPCVFRTVTKDVEFQGTYELHNTKRVEGWKAVCWLRYIHINPDNFDDPMCFNPNRWEAPPKPGTFLAFGRGERLCPGNMLVRLQLFIILHYLVIGYRWELVNPDAKMTYLPLPKPEDGVEINIKKLDNV